jgi:hypothetical protein
MTNKMKKGGGILDTVFSKFMAFIFCILLIIILCIILYYIGLGASSFSILFVCIFMIIVGRYVYKRYYNV